MNKYIYTHTHIYICTSCNTSQSPPTFLTTLLCTSRCTCMSFKQSRPASRAHSTSIVYTLVPLPASVAGFVLLFCPLSCANSVVISFFYSLLSHVHSLPYAVAASMGAACFQIWLVHVGSSAGESTPASLTSHRRTETCVLLKIVMILFC